MKLSDLFLWDTLNDQEGKRNTVRILSIMILTALIIIPVGLLFRMIIEFRFHVADYVLTILIPVFILYYILLKKGKRVLVSMLFIITSWIAMTIMAAASTGIRDVTINGYFLIIFMAVLLTGYRMAILLSAVSIMSAWLMALAENSGILIPPADPSLLYAKDFTFFVIMVLITVILFERSFKYSYNRITRELNERRAAEEKLSLNEKRLLEQNEELLAAKLKAEESDMLKTSFLQNISHEIRTPMNGIVGFAELLKSPGITPKEYEEYFTIMLSCTDQLSSIINNLIDISRIESGTVELYMTDFTIQSLLNELEVVYKKSAFEKKLTMKFINDLRNVTIRSDRGKINQVMSNLISNAIKFTGTGMVEVNACRSEDNLNISVRDTGIGINEKDLEIIFNRFRQADISPSRSFGGAGLGLAICKGVVEYMGGNISVESSPGKGSLFTISVPVFFIDAGTKVMRPTEINVTEEEGRKILIAEDDDASYLYLENLLKHEKIEVIRARTGDEAVSLFSQNNDLNLILMDLKMPEMSGYDALKVIKSIKKNIPVIAVTAFAFDGDRDQALISGFDDYLIKPIRKDVIINKIEKLLYRQDNV
jgi:signal transduction histidine kinase/ActR/RegA family two-component response regulator